MKRISWRLGGRHTAKSCNAIYLSPCQPAETVRLHHWFGQRWGRLLNLDASVWHRLLIWVCTWVRSERVRGAFLCQRSRMPYLGSAERSRFVSILDWGCIWHFLFVLVPQKPIYASGESPVRKAPCCNGFKCTSNSNKHRSHFFPGALRMRIPLRIPQLQYIGSRLSTSHHLMLSVSHGKSW